MSKQQPTHAANVPSSKPKYSGELIDPNSLVTSDGFKSDQARADSLYIAKHGPVELQHAMDPGYDASGNATNAHAMGQVLAVQDDAVANSWGGVNYYSETDYPPTADVRKKVDDAAAWVAANMHQGGKKHKVT